MAKKKSKLQRFTKSQRYKAAKNAAVKKAAATAQSGKVSLT